jgi:Xaa-Pro aminopeptidase
MTPTASLTLPAGPLPFSSALLDGLLDDSAIDVIVVTSKHNVRYLLGGHYHHFFESMEALGISRYLPVLIYVKGRPDQAAYIGFRNEADMITVRNNRRDPLWPPVVWTAASTSLEAVDLAIDHLRQIGAVGKRVAIERAFLPSDAATRLQQAFPEAPLRDGFRALELLRAVKSPQELSLLRQASDAVVDAMLAVFAGHGAGTTKQALIKALRLEETLRGLTFDYALVTVGRSHNRAPSNDVWHEGDVLSLDSGGNLEGYIGDLCRMAVLGDPDAELQDLLVEVDAIQLAARRGIRPGAPGVEIYAHAHEALAEARHARDLRFVAHGMGLVAHEAPRLTASGPVPYPACDAQRPLQPGMVVSIETTLLHPTRGFIKLEDTVAVTEAGCEGFGDRARGWNRGAT